MDCPPPPSPVGVLVARGAQCARAAADVDSLSVVVDLFTLHMEVKAWRVLIECPIEIETECWLKVSYAWLG